MSTQQPEPASSNSPAIPAELLDSIRSGTCVLFTASGFSTRAGLPSWTELLSKLVDFGVAHEVIGGNTVSALGASLNEGDRNSVADELVNAFRSSRDLLQSFLRQSLHVPEQLPPEFQSLSQIPFAAVMTTNLDTLLEKAMPQYSDAGLYTPRNAEQLMDALAQRRKFLLKLYGNISEPETLLFAPIEFRELAWSNLTFMNFIAGMFVSHSFLFVGVSLDSIQEFLSAITIRGGLQPRMHFAVVEVSGSAWRSKASTLERRFNVHVLGSPKGEVEPVRSFLAQLARQARASLPASTEPQPHSFGIRKLILEDIGPYESLEFDFSQDNRWKVLLGDNGVGKSTILKAVAIAMIGSDAHAYAGRLVRAGKTRGRITVTTERNPSGYVTEILTKDVHADSEVRSLPARCMDAESWLAIGFSPLRSVSFKPSAGPQSIAARGRPSSDDVLPLLSGEVDIRMDRLKQWLINLDAANKPASTELRGHTSRVSALAFGPDGRTLVSGSTDRTTRLWDVVTGQLVRKFHDQSAGVNAVAISGDGRVIASGSYDRNVDLWDAAAGDRVGTYFRSSSQILCVSLSTNGSVLAWGSEGGTLRVAASRNVPEQLFRPEQGPIWSVAVSRDGNKVFLGCGTGAILCIDIEHGTHIAFPNSSAPVWSIALSADAQTLVSGDAAGAVAIWNASTAALRIVLQSQGSGILSVAISADGQTVATGDESGNYSVWDVASGRQLIASVLDPRGVWAVALTPDGQTLAAGTDDARISIFPVPRTISPTGSQETISELFRVIATLTDRSDIRFLRIDNNRVFVATAEAPGGIPLEMLSQGLMSLLGWVGCLCQRLKEMDAGTEPLPRDGYALVLLDEIDAHMHPRWQRVLVNRLKKLFPNVQFIASTHSPLIVAGLESEEVIRFERDEEGLVHHAIPSYSLKGMGAAGILTSDLFGLPSMLDEETEAALNYKRELTAELLRKDTPEPRRGHIQEEIEGLNKTLYWVDATMTLRDPLYSLFVEKMALAGQTGVSRTPLSPAQKQKKEETALEIARSLLQQGTSEVLK